MWQSLLLPQGHPSLQPFSHLSGVHPLQVQRERQGQPLEALPMRITAFWPSYLLLFREKSKHVSAVLHSLP